MTDKIDKMIKEIDDMIQAIDKEWTPNTNVEASIQNAKLVGKLSANLLYVKFLVNDYVAKNKA